MDPSQIPDSKWDIYEKLWNSSSVLGSRSDFVTVAFLNMQWWRLELTEILAQTWIWNTSELSALRSSVLPSKDGIPWSLKGYISMELHKHIQVNQSSSQTHLSSFILGKEGSSTAWLLPDHSSPAWDVHVGLPTLSSCTLPFENTKMTITLLKSKFSEAIAKWGHDLRIHLFISTKMLRKWDHYLCFKTHSTTFKMLICQGKKLFSMSYGPNRRVCFVFFKSAKQKISICKLWSKNFITLKV